MPHHCRHTTCGGARFSLPGALPGAGFLMGADGARPGQNPAAAGPAGTGKSRALRAGTRVAGAGGGARASAPHGEERLDIQQQRVEEQAQAKVEASQKFPIRLAGMALFNAFANSKQSGGVDYPVTAAPTGAGHSGATLRQTIVGLEFGGPRAIWGGKVNGSVYMDFFAGGTNSTMRIRTASVEIAWQDRSVAAGLEKPIFNP